MLRDLARFLRWPALAHPFPPACRLRVSQELAATTRQGFGILTDAAAAKLKFSDSGPALPSRSSDAREPA